MEVSEADQRRDSPRRPFWERVRDEIAGKVAAAIVALGVAVLSWVLTPVREATWGRLPGFGDPGASSESSSGRSAGSAKPTEPIKPTEPTDPVSDRYSGLVLGRFSVEPSSFGEAVSLGELSFTPREFTCGPEQAEAEQPSTASPQGQTCELSFDFRNDGKTRQGLAIGDKFRIYVGDDFYDGKSRAGSAFPDAVASGTASFYIPVGVAPSRLVFSHEDYNHNAETTVFELTL